MARCESYFQHGLEHRCFSTEHPAECSCGGDERKCDFFPERREPKTENEKRLIDANAKMIDKHFNKRLIDANPIVQFIMDGLNNPDKLKALGHDAIEVLAEIEFAPTVDAVEVVRCKDCKHYDNSDGICWCKLNSKFFPGGLDWHGFPEDGFCSYGERKDN